VEFKLNLQEQILFSGLPDINIFSSSSSVPSVQSPYGRYPISGFTYFGKIVQKGKRMMEIE
jgi:hypothetical protein